MGTGSRGAGHMWVHLGAEHAPPPPPYTCSPRAPSPIPASAKGQSLWGVGRAGVTRTRPGDQVSGDTIKGEFQSGRNPTP